MPITKFVKELVDKDIWQFLRNKNLGELEIDDPETRLLRHYARNPEGNIVATITSKDPTALDSNSVELSDPKYYWLFFDLITEYEKIYEPTKIKLNCRFRENQIPNRE